MKSYQRFAGNGPTVSYTPKPDGQPATVTYPSGDVAHWSYDYLNRVASLDLSIANQGGNDPTLAYYNYDAGWLASRETCAGVVTAYDYQANNRISVVHQYANGGGNISWRTYGYYANGQMSWFAKANVGGGGGAGGRPGGRVRLPGGRAALLRARGGAEPGHLPRGRLGIRWRVSEKVHLFARSPWCVG